MPQAAAAKLINIISPLRIPAIHNRTTLVAASDRDEFEVPERSNNGTAITETIVTISPATIRKEKSMNSLQTVLKLPTTW
jgi:hypothetical protein